MLPLAYDFQRIGDAAQAVELLMPYAPEWHHFVVMNRSFYKLTPALCSYLVQQGHVYAHQQSGSALVLGARFSPQEAIHIGLFAGDGAACLNFAQQKAYQAGIAQISCIFPQSAIHIQNMLMKHEFVPHPSPYIVMRV